jgi:hypothetical protein
MLETFLHLPFSLQAEIAKFLLFACLVGAGSESSFLRVKKS